MVCERNRKSEREASRHHPRSFHSHTQSHTNAVTSSDNGGQPSDWAATCARSESGFHEENNSLVLSGQGSFTVYQTAARNRG